MTQEYFGRVRKVLKDSFNFLTDFEDSENFPNTLKDFEKF